MVPQPPLASSPRSAWVVLRRFAQRREAVERCELCGVPLATEHPHLVEPPSHRILCACDACAILFSHRAETHYRRVSRRVACLRDFRLSDVQWNALGLPVGLAFFYHSSTSGRVVAVYPSPAGPTESLLDFDGWADLTRDNPILNTLESDTEALLVCRLRPTAEYFLAPLDACYRLVGLVRSHWQGFSGGSELWTKLYEFLDDLKRRSS